MKITNLTRKQKVLILTMIVFVFIVILTIILIILTQRKNDIEEITSYPVSTPVSNINNETQQEEFMNNGNTFELSEISLNPNIEPKKYNFELELPEGYEMESVNNGVRITNEGFNLEIFSTLEGFGGVYNFIPETVLSSTNLFGDIVRVKDLEREFIDDQIGEGFEYKYFYTNSLKLEDECNTDKSALGFSQISCIDQLSVKYKTLDIGIYCLVDSENLLGICDQIVSSMQEYYEIGYVYLGSNQPSGEIIRFKLEKEDNFIKSFQSYSAVVLKNDKVEISFIAPSEDSTGVLDYVPENSEISEGIFRIKSENLYQFTDYPNYPQKLYNLYFLYSDYFRIGAGCLDIFQGDFSPTTSCGNSSLKLNESINPIKIYCGVNEPSDASFCDDVVKTLDTELIELY